MPHTAGGSTSKERHIYRPPEEQLGVRPLLDDAASVDHDHSVAPG